MKIKTSELTRAALDWAVAKCEGNDYARHIHMLEQWEPSTDWAQGGPIIDQKKIDTVWEPNGKPTVMGRTWVNFIEYREFGPTTLIAAMRCYVASALGDEVDVPDELNERN